MHYSRTGNHHSLIWLTSFLDMIISFIIIILVTQNGLLILCQIDNDGNQSNNIPSDSSNSSETKVFLFNKALDLKYSENASPNDLKAAMNIFTKLCNGSDSISVQSLYELGDIYFHGIKGSYDVSRNIPIAISYFNKSASYGHGPSLHIMSIAYSSGLGGILPLDQKMASRLQYLAAITNHIPSVMGMGFKFLYGIGVKKSCGLAIKHYRFAAEAAMRNDLVPSYTVQQDTDRLSHGAFNQWKRIKQMRFQQREFLKFWQQKAQSGDPLAEFELSRMYRDGNIAKQDYRKAVNLSHRAAEKDFVPALRDLGIAYMQGLGVEKDYKKSFYYFQKAADMGDPESQNYVGYIYYFGPESNFGIEKNETKAMEYLLKSASQDFAEALFFLGEHKIKAFSDDDSGVKDVDYQAALHYYSRAADQGYTQGFWREAQIYESRRGVSASCEAAVHAYKVIAESAMWLDHVRRAISFYLEDDIEGTLLSYLVAAEEGHEIAQSNVGWLLQNVKQSLFKKENLKILIPSMYERAYLQGNPDVLRSIADIHYNGKNGHLKDHDLVFKIYLTGLHLGDIKTLEPLGSLLERKGTNDTRFKAQRLYKFAVDNDKGNIYTIPNTNSIIGGYKDTLKNFLRRLQLKYKLYRSTFKNFF